jgi:3-methyladenine DNA glycosylase/8-oxoguanine DNA glycosylase
MAEDVWPEAVERLRQDPSFGPLVERVGPVRLRESRGGSFAALTASIIYQQLAGKAARTIHGRVVAALGGQVTEERVLAAPAEALRGAGLSRSKLAAICDLAEKSRSGAVPLDDLGTLDDAAVVARLTRVRGIGPWTAQMHLLFELRRPDVWPVGDLGVRAGLGKVLGLTEPPTVEQTGWIGVGFRPWRSAVAWYCWRAADSANQPADEA